ncbi:MAG: PilZ domain-containing protein [Desulfuromonadales bacterium]|nr:PilZ domain-containing protein [Desulfuromonadales bacterium]MBN2793741.1 PilZ domain-containing protein [Desulfuromonadales bacterium]
MNDQSERPVADLRTNLRAPLIIQKVHLGHVRPAFFGYSKNISKSGMFIATTNPIEPGERIEIEFQLPPPLTGSARCLCEVVWKRPFGSHLPFEPGIGMKFIDMPEDISERIDAWIVDQQQP